MPTAAMVSACMRAITMLMVMVIALYIRIIAKFPFDQRFCRCIAGSRYAAIQLDTCIGKGHLRAAADAAADQRIDLKRGKQPRKRSVTAAIGVNDFTGDDFSIFDGIDLKLPCVSKVLKNLSIFISCRNFHFNIPP